MIVDTVGLVRGVTLDVADLSRAEHFWTSILGGEVADRYDTYAWLDEIAPGIRLILQEVPEPKTGKNRMHLDLSSPDPQSLKDRVVALGGAHVSDFEDPAYSLSVMADPDGNEFCISSRLSPTLVRRHDMPR